MKELKQMFWMMLGVVGGFALGAYVLVMHIFRLWPHLQGNPSLCLLVLVPVLGGGLVGGGYLAQWLVYRYDRAQRRKRQAEKDMAKPGKKKRKRKK